jgi:hypothetical protein
MLAKLADPTLTALHCDESSRQFRDWGCPGGAANQVFMVRFVEFLIPRCPFRVSSRETKGTVITATLLT